MTQRRQLPFEEQQQLDLLLHKLQEKNATALGYPTAKDFDYTELYKFLQFSMNNLGDPFVPSLYQVDTRPMEREVVSFMAALLRAPEDNWWGYVTHGGSESNMYGLYVARELYPHGMVYYSNATHYSVGKNLRILNMPHTEVSTQTNGEIDYTVLKDKISANREKPAIIFANIGTTMKEAKDDIRKIKEILYELGMDDYYIHADGALAGMFAPYLTPKPAFDFADGADSVSISGHKFIGSPIPCGVLLTKKTHKNRIARDIAYIGSEDTTIPGSRNGFTPLIWWYAIKTMGHEGFKQRIEYSLSLAAYTLEQLQNMGIKAWRNPNAITVVFPKPSMELVQKWQLAIEDDIAHVILMPNCNKEQIDLFLKDMEAERISSIY
ncbi:histidine decarboxylase [Limibacter armeniacum]|uniref:histidine decarboxylase n=1 Tax=Limibacter armeniacum TaxID=466084 RepID=UPI002FE65457